MKDDDIKNVRGGSWGNDADNCRSACRYRIRYWLQETTESGRWCLTGLMTAHSATVIAESAILERPQVVEDSEYEGI